MNKKKATVNGKEKGLTIYTSYNCSGAKKALQWCKKKGLSFDEFNFSSKRLTEEEVRYLLQKSRNGFDDIISTRSHIYFENKELIEEMKTSELISFIIENPTVLKRPIITDEVTDQLIIGWNEDELNCLI